MRAVAERSGEGLDLRPLRGLRYQPGRVGDLGRVLCPPYDVAREAGRAALLRSHPYNLVRLTLPTAGSAARAAALLDEWIRDGVLAVDPEPAFYVAQIAVGSRVTRGLVATVGLDDDALLPHEAVTQAGVDERAALLDATGCDLEPLLLSVEGGLGGIADAVALADPPVVTAGAGGQSLALWPADASRWSPEVAAMVRGRRALVADGHHRLAAARRHQTTRRRAAGPGPWDRVLALVVEPARHPLLLDAIHRRVPVPASRLLDAWSSLVDVRRLSADDRVVPVPRCRGRLVVGDARGWWEVRGLGAAASAGGCHSDRWHALDAAVLHETLLPRAGVPESAVAHHHDPWAAVHGARAEGGAAVLLHAPGRTDVAALAAAGEPMPRKTTSFGPKPPSGLVLRRHADG